VIILMMPSQVTPVLSTPKPLNQSSPNFCTLTCRYYPQPFTGFLSTCMKLCSAHSRKARRLTRVTRSHLNVGTTLVIRWTT